MSASEAEPASSRIPSETWHDIFDLATYADDAFGDKFYARFEALEPLAGPRREPSLCHSLMTRRALPLVCKAWYKTSIRFLYRSIWIYRCSGSVLHFLLSGLLDSKSQTRFGEGPLGLYTDRIDVLFPEEISERLLIMDSLVSILELLPDLSTVVFSAPSSYTSATQVPKPLINMLCSIGPSLQVVDWSGVPLIMDSYDLRALCCSAPNLRILTFDMCSRRTNLSSAANADQDTVHLPAMSSLTTLKYNFFTKQVDLSPVNFPHLRQLILTTQPNRYHRSKLHYLEPLVPSLETISFDPSVGRSSTIDTSLQDDLNRIGATCPSLKQLTFVLGPDILGRPRFDDIRVPSVFVLGIRFRQNYMSSPGEEETLSDVNYKQLWTALSVIRSNQPSIETIQFMEDPESFPGCMIKEGNEKFPQLRMENHWDAATS